MTVHPGLSAVIAKCLSKNPEERYQSGAELARDLENYRSIGSEGEITSVLSDDVRAQATQARSSSSGAWKSGPMAAISSGAYGAAVQQSRIGTSSESVPPLPHSSTKISAPTSATQLWSKRAKMASIAVAVITLLAAATAFTAKYWKKDATDSTQPGAGQTSHAARINAQSRLAGHGASSGGSGRVEMRITSKPEGALVQLDGVSNPAWVTPYTAPDLRLGTHNLIFTKQGYADETRKLEINPSSSSYHINLTPMTTSVSVTSEPAGAGVEIDGVATGKLTPIRVPVAPGQHKIVVHLDGYRNAQVTTAVNNGQVFRFSPVLNPTDAREAGNSNGVTTRFRKLFGGGIPAGKGMIDFVTSPPGARIVVNGKPVAVATPAHAPFPPGNYRVELRQSGYKPVQQTVHVEVGKISKVEAKLDPQ